MKLLQGKLGRSFLGVGLLRKDRVAGDGNTADRQTGLSIAYHTQLNKNKELPSTISIGLQASLLQKRGIAYYDTWVMFTSDYVIDPYVDYNAGLMYTGYLSSRFSLYSGLSVFYFREPVEIILGEPNYIKIKPLFQLGGVYIVNKRFTMFFSSLYERQGENYDVLVGGAVGYNLTPKESQKPKQFIALLGTWYKLQDAVAPYLGFEWKGFRLGLSSDIGLESSSSATRGRGAFELSLIYNGGFGSENNSISKIAVPRF